MKSIGRAYALFAVAALAAQALPALGQERLCADGKRSYFGVCPDDGNKSRPLAGNEPNPPAGGTGKVATPAPAPAPAPPAKPVAIPAPPAIRSAGQEITDGYPTGRKIHMVGGANGKKPYLGFILNISPKVEDEYVMSGDFTKAFSAYQALAKAGDKTAAHNLGLMLIRGLGVKKDIRLGMSYLEKSMEDLPNYGTAKIFYDRAAKELAGQ